MQNTSIPHVDVILRHMRLLHARFRRTKKPITSVHQDTMTRHRGRWSGTIGSARTCFMCLRRRPEYRLTCTHMLCLGCVKDFGDQGRQNPDRFTVRACFLCGCPSDLVVLDRPPTAGVGLLCLDGGGVRGIIQTVILSVLEERIGLRIPVQEHFQLAAGVSAGTSLPAGRVGKM